MSSSGLEINVLDLVDPGVATIEAGLKQKSNQAILKYGGMCNGVGQMVTQATGLASSGRIQVLRIWSHGSPGGQGVTSAGSDAQHSPKGQRAGISLGNLPEVQGDLARLAPFMAPGGRVELRGCSVGTGDDGARFLQALAGLMRTDVLAAKNPQPIGPLEWAGPVLKAMRNGGVATISGPSIE